MSQSCAFFLWLFNISLQNRVAHIIPPKWNNILLFFYFEGHPQSLSFFTITDIMFKDKYNISLQSIFNPLINDLNVHHVRRTESCSAIFGSHCCTICTILLWIAWWEYCPKNIPFWQMDTEMSITDIENGCAISKWQINTAISTTNTGNGSCSNSIILHYFRGRAPLQISNFSSDWNCTHGKFSHQLQHFVISK